MKNWFLAGIVFATSLSTAGFAQLKRLAISDVKPAPALVASTKQNGTDVAMWRVVEAFDSQLTNRMQESRKFSIVARSDLKSLIKDSDVAGSAFKIAAADYVLVTTLDDFQDYKEELVLATTGEHLTKRVVRATAVAKIYDAKDGHLIESANITKTQKDKGAQFDSAKNGDLSDALLQAVVEQVAAATAARVTDVIYPAKVLSKLDRTVTINRGDGTSIAVGQIWQIWALGEELRDPDTGEVLDRQRLAVGKVKITVVNPKTSMAEIIEDTGITTGAIAQPVP